MGWGTETSVGWGTQSSTGWGTQSSMSLATRALGLFSQWKISPWWGPVAAAGQNWLEQAMLLDGTSYPSEAAGVCSGLQPEPRAVTGKAHFQAAGLWCSASLVTLVRFNHGRMRSWLGIGTGKCL